MPTLHPTLSEKARVITVYSACCDVQLNGDIQLCNLQGHIATTQKTSLAVGDWVEVQDVGAERPLVTRVHPRTTFLSRPDPMRPDIERVLVSNVDMVCMVVAAKKPRPSTGLIDRMWVAIQHGGAQPALVVNKMDLLRDAERDALDDTLSDYRALELPIFYVSTHTGEGIEELQHDMRDKLTALVGHSGVGKSSLVNTLVPQAEAKTSDVRASSGKGRHTTSASTWYTVNPTTALVDTPGVRTFGLMDVGSDALRFYFPDIHQFALDCYFSNCLHEDEPGCAVQEAIENGDISIARYETWLRLLRSEEDWRLPRGTKAR